MTTISARTILRSRNTTRPEHVLSTLLLRYPRFIHAEFMTHRSFSKNAASSRAIPVKKLIQDVIDDPAVPLFWGKNQRGMQAGEECRAIVAVPYPSETVDKTPLDREDAWLLARNRAVEVATAFDTAGYHKQICNRLLEPFAHITVLVSSTQWSNFLALRDHPDAEPHIQVLAREMRRCLENDPVQDLQPGEWHLPFVGYDERERIMAMSADQDEGDKLALQLSTACCASTSYKTVDGFDMTLDRAIEIHDKLVGSRPLHASPAEHVAQADEWMDGRRYGAFHEGWRNEHEFGNFVGFRQYRKMLPDECL